MIDRSLMIAILDLLDQLSGASLAEDALFNEVALRATLAPTTSQIREQLRFAEQKGWIEVLNGRLNERRWRITGDGSDNLRDLKP